MANFDEVRKLEDAKINPGERWIFSADANDPDLGRLDEEAEDILQILNGGGSVVMLAHEGRYGKAKSLESAAKHLSAAIRRGVKFCGIDLAEDYESANRFVHRLGPGEIAFMENIRKYSGEEENNADFAEDLAMLANKAAIGGFGKAHRKNASNYGILELLPGYLARSQIREMSKLEQWAGKQEGYSVAVLGGVKKEKITVGLKGFAKTFDVIIPGGIVLNTIFKAKGYDVGDSVLEDGGKTFEKQVKEIIDNPERRAEICIPEIVVVAKKDDYEKHQTLPVSSGIPKGYMIVDYLLPSSAVYALEKAGESHGRVIIAGTPGFYKKGFTLATAGVLLKMRALPVRGLVLGGDTASELEYSGEKSSGGGSALYFIANGTTPVFDKLKENMRKIFC